jgi:hypothetical protein
LHSPCWPVPKSMPIAWISMEWPVLYSRVSAADHPINGYRVDHKAIGPRSPARPESVEIALAFKSATGKPPKVRKSSTRADHLSDCALSKIISKGFLCAGVKLTVSTKQFENSILSNLAFSAESCETYVNTPDSRVLKSFARHSHVLPETLVTEERQTFLLSLAEDLRALSAFAGTLAWGPA